MRQDGIAPARKITTLPDVREWNDGMPVELWINRSGRLVLRSYNEDGHNSTEVDVLDLLDWLESDNGLAIIRPFATSTPPASS